MSVIFGLNRPKGFEPLHLTRTSRRASKAQWDALKARDKGCVRCGKPPRYTQAHHIIHWKDGGLTDITNLVLLCARCHHDLHLGYFNVTMGDDGIPILIQGRGPPGKRVG
ncbi:MAG: HNH endonuclease signature motif containing protein [Candidatus Nanopelagicales bacterium]